MTAPCLACGTTGGTRRAGRELPSRIRGLCDRCYIRAYRAGTLDDWPRTLANRADLIDDLEVIADGGGTITEAVTRTRRTREALWIATKRAGRRDLYRRLVDREERPSVTWKEDAS